MSHQEIVDKIQLILDQQSQLQSQLIEAHPELPKIQKDNKNPDTAYLKVAHVMLHVPEYTERTIALKNRFKNIEERTLKLKYALLK